MIAHDRLPIMLETEITTAAYLKILHVIIK